MTISLLRTTDFRNLKEVELRPSQSGLNVIYGKNGSGKTSLLETIYYLGHGRSFRPASLETLVRKDQSKFSVFCQVQGEFNTTALGVERDVNGVSLFRIDEKNINSISKFAQYLPIRTIDSSTHQLFEAGPLHRRQYLDWGLFYQDKQFLTVWRQFERTLKQRNNVLRERRSKSEWDVWTQAFVAHSLELDALRRAYVSNLTPVMNKMVSALLPFSDLELAYQPGWDAAQDLNDVMLNAHQDELRVGYSLFGPHRADLDIRINGVSAKLILSRGQQKLMGCAMILSQGMLLREQLNQGLIYLVDDLPSELDKRSTALLIALLIEQSTQVFITAINSESILESVGNHPSMGLRMFHVEHGVVTEVALQTTTQV